jgi:hypothetical protein
VTGLQVRLVRQVTDRVWDRMWEQIQT